MVHQSRILEVQRFEDRIEGHEHTWRERRTPSDHPLMDGVVVSCVDCDEVLYEGWVARYKVEPSL